MNDAIVFDTHRFVRNLTESGFTERQAEALANEQVELLNSNLATKADMAAVQADIAAVKSDLEVRIERVQSDLELKITNVQSDLELKIANVQSDMAGLKADLEVKIANAKSDQLKWMFAAFIAQGGVIVTLITLL